MFSFQYSSSLFSYHLVDTEKTSLILAFPILSYLVLIDRNLGCNRDMDQVTPPAKIPEVTFIVSQI